MSEHFVSPAFLNWAEAFDFATGETVRALEALSHGDTDAAKGLLESSEAARELSHAMYDRACR